MKRIAIVASCFVLLFRGEPCGATNMYFLPGDAFFHTVLTEQKVNELKIDRQPVFEYMYPVTKTGGLLCGYAGYFRVQLTDLSPRFRGNLRQAYYHFRQTHPKRIEITDETKYEEIDGEELEVPTGKKIEQEINGFSVYFYNASFDWNRHRIGVKYNERWVEQTMDFGLTKKHVRLETFVPSAGAMMIDWRDGPSVAPLQAIVPSLADDATELDRSQTGKVVSTPIRMTGKMRALVFPAGRLQSIFERAEWPSFLEVTEDGVRSFRFEDGNWKATNVVISVSP